MTTRTCLCSTLTLNNVIIPPALTLARLPLLCTACGFPATPLSTAVEKRCFDENSNTYLPDDRKYKVSPAYATNIVSTVTSKFAKMYYFFIQTGGSWHIGTRHYYNKKRGTPHTDYFKWELENIPSIKLFLARQVETLRAMKATSSNTHVMGLIAAVRRFKSRHPTSGVANLTVDLVPPNATPIVANEPAPAVSTSSTQPVVDLSLLDEPPPEELGEESKTDIPFQVSDGVVPLALPQSTTTNTSTLPDIVVDLNAPHIKRVRLSLNILPIHPFLSVTTNIEYDTPRSHPSSDGPIATTIPTDVPTPDQHPITCARPYLLPETVKDKPSYTFNHRYSLDSDFAKRLEHLPFSVNPSRSVHPHPIASLERLCCYDYIVHNLPHTRAKILDVGSNVQKFRSVLDQAGLPHTHVHGIMPQILAEDAKRIKYVDKKHPGYTHCTHRVQDCTCYYTPDLITFIHSAYYIPHHDICKTIIEHRDATCFVVVHNLDDGAGKLCHGEGTYYPELNNGSIVCKFKGNPPYIHPPLTWMNAPHLNYGSHTMSWRLLSTFGDTRLYSFTVGYNSIPNSISPNTWQDPLDNARQTFYDSATNKKLQSAFDSYESPVSKIEILCGTHIAYHRNKKFVVVPRALLGKLATTRALNPVTPTMVATLSRVAKNFLNAIDMPEDVRGDVVTFSVAVALIQGVNFETAVLGDISKFSETFRAHKAALELQPLPEARWWHRLLNMLTPRFCDTRFESSDVAADWHNLALQQGQASIQTVAHLPAVAKLRGITNMKTSEPKLYPNARLLISEENNPKTFQEPTNRLSVVGIVFDNATPQCFVPNKDAAVRAITSRLLLDTRTNHSPGEVAKSWCKAMFLIKYYFTFSDIIPDYKTLYETWNCRFPIATQTKNNQARQSLISTPLQSEDYNLEVITKIEKGKTCIDFEAELANPRAVCNCSARFNVTTGPYFYAFSQALKNKYNFDNSFTNAILWTSGCSAEQAGNFFDHWVNEFGDVEYLVLDQSSFDAHQSEGSFCFEHEILRNFKVPPIALAAHRSAAVPRGSHQKYNIRFQCSKPTRTSGSGITSAGNVTISIASILLLYGRPGTNYAFMANGDDVLLIARRDFIKSDEIDPHMSSLGLEVKWHLTDDPTQVEFCQCLPYPTSSGTVFAPKVGRLMTRLGFSTSTLPVDVFGIARGLEQSVSFVPFLTEFITKLLGLAGSCDAIENHWSLRATNRHTATQDTFAFIYKRYNIDHSAYTSFLQLLTSVTKLPAVLPTHLDEYILNMAKIDAQ